MPHLHSTQGFHAAREDEDEEEILLDWGETIILIANPVKESVLEAKNAFSIILHYGANIRLQSKVYSKCSTDLV